MLVYKKGIQADTYVTLNDSLTLSSPYFLFVFRNPSTKEEVKAIVSSVDDKSSYPERINQFAIDMALFTNRPTGQWMYDVYEQLSAVNEAIEGLNLVETGRMLLMDSNEQVAYQAAYQPTTQFK